MFVSYQNMIPALTALAVWSEQSKRINHYRGKTATIKSFTCLF